MKNLQYLKLFEAFESKTLTKVFNYVNKSQRGQFKSILEEFCNKTSFPMSKLSDDLFQYLPYNKALSLAANMEDEPCDNESDTISGEKCSGPTGDEMQGTIMRTWGRGRRKVKCDVCNGTGIKPKNEFPIKWVKFWFDKDGKYVNATATDGKIRPQSGFGSAGTLDDNIDKYEVEKENLTYSDLNDYMTGDIFYFRPSDGNDNSWRVAMLYKEGRMNYMLQNRSAGSAPGGTEWKKIARYSWVVSSASDIRGGTNMKKLKLKVEEAKEEEGEVKPDPYTWNAPLEIRRISLGNSADVKEYLKQAHFALILDYVKMKEIMRTGKVTDTDVTKAERTESKKGALALELPNDIKAANFSRYIKQISKNIKITDDISSLRRIFQRVFGFGYAGHYILQGLNFSAMEEIFDNIVTFMTSNDSDKQRYVDRASRGIKERMEANIEYNNNMKKNLDYLITNSPDEDHTNLVEMLIEVNKAIVKKIQDAPLETIEEALILYNKIRNMRDSYRNSPLFKKCQRASNVNYYLEASDLDQPLRYLKAIDNYDIPDILSNFDQYINFINKL
jgi:hypothetical protein